MPADRVVHITTVHHPHDPRIFYKEIPSLCAAGYDVHLIARSIGREAVAESSATTTQPVPDPSNPSIHFFRPAAGFLGRLRRGFTAYRKARALDGAVYHIHDPELLPFLWRLKRTTKGIAVYDMHENYRARGVSGMFIRALERWSFKWLDHVILADQAYLPVVARERVPHTVIENYPLAILESADRGVAAGAAPATDHVRSVDTGAAVAGTRSHGRRHVHLIYTGVMSRARGLFEMLEVIGRMAASSMEGEGPSNEPAVRLDLVGTCYIDVDREEANRLIAIRDLGGVVNRVGWDQYVDAAEMVPYLRDAFVGLILLHPHPNYVNVLPTKLFEYLQHGLPVICSDFPRLRAFVEVHQCGAVVDPADTDEIVRIVTDWLANPDVYRKLAENALQTSQRFRWDEMGERLQSVYAGLLETD